MRRSPLVPFAAGLLALAALPLHAQVTPAGGTDSTARDSTARDSLRPARLARVRVRVTGTPDSLATVPWSVGVAGVRELRRGQATLGLDEALGGIPGVYVANRYNYAVDQRVAIRGFGARANFGVRGLTVLLDGIPQTLPDGQSQLTNVELGALSRVEVLRGASSALWGNGSGGVIAFETDMRAPAPFQQAVRVEGGAFGLRKAQLRTSGRTGRMVGALSLSRLTTDGFRQYAAADVRQLNAGADIALSGTTTASVRAHAADTPLAENPGALTFGEYGANPDSASRFNIARGADKRVRQQQLAFTLRRDGGAGGTSLGATTWGVRRDLRNAISAPPPGGGALANGTYITIDRGVAGLRLDGARSLGAAGAAGPRAPRLPAGVDLQRMRDERRNRRATGGRPTTPTDTLVLHQLETVTSVGPFASLTWSPATRVRLDAGGRWDRIRFDVADRFTREGGAAANADDSDARTITARSGHVGASLLLRPWLIPYTNLSTSFETPTTTELASRQDGSGGFADDLGPQRARALELGARGDAGTRLQYSAALYTMQVDDAIVQFAEIGQRAFFRNAGRVDQSGAELGARLRVAPLVALEGAYTYSRFRFDRYRVERRITADSTATDVRDGNQVPGVPPHLLRVGVRMGPVRGLTLDADHNVVSAQYADDANAQRVRGWGRGVLNARMAWSTRVAGLPFEPFAGVRNAFDQAHVTAVTVNGANGRVLEPGTPRAWYVGAEVGWAR